MNVTRSLASIETATESDSCEVVERQAYRTLTSLSYSHELHYDTICRKTFF